MRQNTGWSPKRALVLLLLLATVLAACNRSTATPTPAPSTPQTGDWRAAGPSAPVDPARSTRVHFRL
ncbi:MAG: hypothetical protein NZ562_03885, partial [Thermomicrobium sp.]|nr:hypothetical protein [Thermomicrobium sp.]